MGNNQMMPRPPFYGYTCKAKYLEQEVPNYKGNPFIEALPKINEFEEIIEKISCYPEYDEEQREWPIQTRMHCIQQISSFIQPLRFHISLELKFSRMIRYGYVSRNPLSSSYARQFAIGIKNILDNGNDGEGYNLVGQRSSALGFAGIGISGIGKTTAIERILLLYPQVIEHTEYGGALFLLKQLVWLKLECPSKGSTKALCINFFQAVDDALGTNYYKNFVKSRSTTDTLLPQMAHVASLHGLGILVIDEIQRLKVSNSGGAEVMMEFFTDLVNVMSVPIVLIGTYKAMFLFNSVFANARRAAGQGDEIIDRMENNEEFRNFLENLWEYQWTKKKVPLTEELIETIYDESQGITDIVAKLYMHAQWNAIINGTEKVTKTGIREVAKNNLKLIQPMIKALRSGDNRVLYKYDDLHIEWNSLNNYIKNFMSRVELHGKVKHQHSRADDKLNEKSNLLELVKLGIALGVAPGEAEQIASSIISSTDGMANLTIMKRTMANYCLDKQPINETKEFESIPSKKLSVLSKKKVKLDLEDKDIRKIKSEGSKLGKSVDEVLREANIIKNFDEFVV